MVVGYEVDTLRVRFDEGDPVTFNWVSNKLTYDSIKQYLLGWSEIKGSNWIRVEDNIVNRIVLGLNDSLSELRRVEDLRNPEELTDYQVRDVQRMVQNRKMLNFNPMGLGKTVEAIVACRELGLEQFVVIAPKPVCTQWVHQIERWMPQLQGKVGLYTDSKPVAVYNYEKLLGTQAFSKLCTRRWEGVIYDEIHKLKNRNSKRTQLAKQVPGLVRFGLSGTPILRQPDDLWSILHAIDWRYSGKYYWNFVRYFCEVEIGHFGQSITGLTKDPLKLKVLHELLDLVSVRNDVEAALGKRRVYVPIAMSPKQKTLYNNIKKLVFAELPEHCTIANGAVLATRLQQTTTWPGLFDCEDVGGKFEWVAEAASGVTEQMVVFTRFEPAAQALVAYLKSCGTTAVAYTGKQTTEEKDQAKEDFRAGKYQVLVGTIGAMGEGVDGLQVARIGIMLDRSWSPTINDQCEDRLNRRGQEQAVIIYYLDCEKTFDQHVDHVNLTKSDSIREALND